MSRELLKGLQEELRILKWQFDVISTDALPHKRLNLAVKLSELQRTIMQLERLIEKLEAEEKNT